MPTIINISQDRFVSGDYPAPRPGAVAIQIGDWLENLPSQSVHQFSRAHQFAFLDVEPGDIAADAGISRDQAQQIAEVLQYALHRNLDVVVHCRLGQSRSAAVALAGQWVGFTPIGDTSGANDFVATSIIECLP